MKNAKSTRTDGVSTRLAVTVHRDVRDNAVHPPGASPWTMKMQIAFLFPKLTKQQEKMLLEQKLKQMDQPTPEKM